MTDINLLLRENIKKLVPYASARDEFSGSAHIFLDANENSLGSPVTPAYNRYPDPHQIKIKEQLTQIKGLPPPEYFSREMEVMNVSICFTGLFVIREKTM